MADPRYTLLFVDDEEDVLDILRRTFERRFNVVTASSGEDALRVLRAQEIDVLITDQKMESMTGIELVAQARSEGIDVTAILLTGYTDPDDLIAAINKGQVFRYVTKPWDVNDLVITVKNAIEVTQLRRDKDRLLRQLNKRVEALSVLYEVSHQSVGTGGALSYDAIIDRVLTAVARVLPYDCGAALVALDERSVSLRLRSGPEVGEKGLIAAKDQVLSAHRRQTGVLLSEEKVITRVSGTTHPDAGIASFGAQLSVSLVSGGRPVGTLSLFARAPDAYSAEDGELLDVLANQTADAILSLRATEEEARLRIERMVESMADGVLLTDEKNDVVVLNPAARRLLHLPDDPAGWSSRLLQEVLGFHPFELVRSWEYGGAQVLREDLTLFGRTLQSTLTPVADSSGGLKGVCLVLRDITEQRELEDRKEEFVSIVSHELRTPLTSISGALDLVLNFLAGEINEKQQRYLSMAKESTDKLNAIVDDLLDISKFAKGRMKMSFELTHLDQLVRGALERYGPALQEKGLRLHLDLPKVAVRVLADQNRITQVLNNLLTNAVKFTPEGGEIEIRCAVPALVPGHVVLTCWNSGEGIKEADVERIFDKFAQARTERTRTIRGTGLGLAICRSILESHGGLIWAEPSVHGACFVVVLPVEPPQALVLAASADDELPPAAPPPHRGPRRTALVVEEAPDAAYALKGLLIGQGLRVLLASSVEDALVVARRSTPELLLIDAALRGAVDGLALVELFRHDPATRGAASFVLADAESRARAYRAGATAVLPRPLVAHALHAAVEALSQAKPGRSEGRVLVVDDDRKIAAICEEVLVTLGFEVTTAGTLSDARRAIRERRPDVLLLDVQLPDGDGFSFLEELKAERAAGPLSVIFISARAETASKVKALRAGGDDYLTKPFDAQELGARVESVVRRRAEELSSSPTTQLPGSNAIEREVQRRLGMRRPFAFCYLDLDNLKAYNDYYGFAKADGVVRQTGDLLREIVGQYGTPQDFLGHVAGDDFVFITEPRAVDAVCGRVLQSFDRLIPLYYDRQDRERGHIETEDRFGERRRFPIMSVSVVAVMCDGASTSHAELARLAADLKKRAKAIPGSVYLRSDREVAARSIA